MFKQYKCNKCFIVFNKKTNYIRHISRKFQCVITDREHITEPVKDYAEINEYETILPLVIKTSEDHKMLEQYQIEEYIHKIKYYKIINYKLKIKIGNMTNTKPLYSIESLFDFLENKKPVNFYNVNSIKIFGDEDISYINDDFMKKIIINPFQGIINLIREIHFNSIYKMNHNLIISSIKFNKVEIFTECGWKLFPKKDVFHNIITTKKDIIDTYYEKLIKMNELNVFQVLEYKRFDKIINNYIQKIIYPTLILKITNEDKRIYRMLIDEILLLFINNYRDSKMIKNQFVPFDEKILEKKNVIFS
jgi:hypothetical protein